MVSRQGALPAPLPLRAPARCVLLRTGKRQTIAHVDPAKNIKLIEIIVLLLVHKDFNNKLLHHQNNLKTQLMLNLDSRKGSSPSNPIPRTALRAHSELFSACDPAFTCSLCAECCLCSESCHVHALATCACHVSRPVPV